MYKLPEVAERLDVSLDTARRYVRSGQLGSVFIGNAYRVSEEDLEAFIASRRSKPPKAQAQPGEERLPRSVGQQLAEDPAGDVNLLESWSSEGGTTGFSNKYERSLIWTLIQLDTEIQAAGESQAERLEYIDGRLGEEDSPTLRKWLETRREWVQQDRYVAMDEATTQFAQRRVAERMKRALATA